MFKDTLDEIAPMPSNMEVEMLKQWDEERDRADQRNRGLEESLGIALQAIERLEEIMQAKKSGKAREEQSISVLEEGKEVKFFPTREIPAGASRRNRRRRRISDHRRRREAVHPNKKETRDKTRRAKEACLG